MASMRRTARQAFVSLLLMIEGSKAVRSSSVSAFVAVTRRQAPVRNGKRLPLLGHAENHNNQQPWAALSNVDDNESNQQIRDLRWALERVGFRIIDDKNDEKTHVYQYSRATGMLKLVSSPTTTVEEANISNRFQAPRWISIVNDEESVLAANGWSFLDPDANDPLSPFDVDAANLEGLYIPKWGHQGSKNNQENDHKTIILSSLGFDLEPLSAEQVQQIANGIQPLSRLVLLEGKTDPPQLKTTQNNVKFTGSTGQSDIEKGVFVCAIGVLPLFTTMDLSPTTASSGWLSFSRPVADDHLILVQPEEGSLDQRVEVVCARTKCHLGHHFGSDGYCINASALNFIPKVVVSNGNNQLSISGPESWRKLESAADSIKSPSLQLLRDVLESNSAKETLVLGAGCFWHVEFALRRLPGVIATEVGYAGGTTSAPTYVDVCEKETAHAEVVKVTFDPRVLNPRVLIDCFLSLHDPTKVRAHGKHASGTGQYRSCIFVTSPELEQCACDAIQDCKLQLGKDLITEIRCLDKDSSHWFWRAEDYHQRHDERRRDLFDSDVSTLPPKEWLLQYGKRSASILGSSETMVTSSASLST